MEDVLIEAIKKFGELKSKKDNLSSELDNIKKEYAEMESIVFDMMFNMDIQSIVVGNRLFYRNIKEYPRIVSQELFFNWLREHGYGLLIKETVNANTLKAWYKEYREAEPDINETDLSGMLDIFEDKGIGIRKTSQ